MRSKSYQTVDDVDLTWGIALAFTFFAFATLKYFGA
jgi:hypothetical protein